MSCVTLAASPLQSCLVGRAWLKHTHTHLDVGDEQQLGELGAAVDQAVPVQQIHSAVGGKSGLCW